MAMDMMYTVLLMRLGSNSLYKSTNRSALQEKKKRAWERWNMKPDCKCYEHPTQMWAMMSHGTDFGLYIYNFVLLLIFLRFPLLKFHVSYSYLGGLLLCAPLYRYTRLQKWTANCSSTVRTVYRLKMLGKGRSLDRVFKGWDEQMSYSVSEMQFIKWQAAL